MTNRHLDFERAANRISSISARLATLFSVLFIAALPFIFANMSYSALTVIMVSIAFAPVVGAAVFIAIGSLGFLVEKIFEKIYFNRR